MEPTRPGAVIRRRERERPPVATGGRSASRERGERYAMQARSPSVHSQQATQLAYCVCLRAQVWITV